MPPRTERLLILIVAYNAESTICDVLDRIPRSVLLDYDCEVLVIDDASDDTTFAVGRSYRASRPDLPLTVLRNPVNQGYGGNQKLGYQYAIEEGFDYVALVHGDGQYAPEELPGLLQPLVQGDADAVFGSRMMVPGAARKGGMPLYKYVGNKILTGLQNRLMGADLSEWHSGYRLYRVSTLASLPLEANRNDFAFDSQIILQLLVNGSRIQELPIPTYYGDEICYVDGVRYGGQVLAATAAAALHRRGLVRETWLATDATANEHYSVKLDYASSHSEVLARVEPGARVLDLGAGPGAFASALADRGAVVSTADLFPPAVHDPRVTSHVADLNEPLRLPLDDYDDVLMLDVIEHLADPEAFLRQVRLGLGERPRRLVLTTPNVAFLLVRLLLLLGRFEYTQRGILDRTHTRLFTFTSIRRALAQAGFDVTVMRGIPAPIPDVVSTRWLARLLMGLNQLLIRVAPRLFSYQILVEATSRPHLSHLLAATRASARSAA